MRHDARRRIYFERYGKMSNPYRPRRSDGYGGGVRSSASVAAAVLARSGVTLHHAASKKADGGGDRTLAFASSA
jgi:hypothetical protein